MEVDLYQRRGFYGLGAVDPVTGLDTSADLTVPAIAPASTSAVSTLASGFDLSSMSPTTLLVLGAGGLWFLSTLVSGSKKAYRRVARPIKKHRKQKRELAEAEEQYQSRRKRILSGKSSSRGGGFF